MSGEVSLQRKLFPHFSLCFRSEEKEKTMGGTTEEWRKNADTTKMSSESVKAAGVEASKRPPGQNPGGVLHQRRNLPFSPYAMALGGFLIVGTIGYLTLYSKKKPEVSALEVAKVSTGTADPKDTHPRPTKG